MVSCDYAFRTQGGSPTSGLLAALILERDLKLRSIGESTILADLDVLLYNLGDTEVTERAACRLEGNGRSVLA
jgi:hypothetical protein